MIDHTFEGTVRRGAKDSRTDSLLWGSPPMSVLLLSLLDFTEMNNCPVRRASNKGVAVSSSLCLYSPVRFD